MKNLKRFRYCQRGKKNKRRFTSKNRAKDFKIIIEEIFSKTFRIYKCPFCKGWHLTSKEFYKGVKINDE